MNYERLPPPTLAEATELVEATVAAFQTGIGEVRTAATVLGLLQSPRHGSPTKRFTWWPWRSAPDHVQQVIIGPPPARMTGLGAVQPIASDPPGRSDLPATAKLFRSLKFMQL